MTKRSRGLAPFDQPLYLDVEPSDPVGLDARRDRPRPMLGFLCRVVVLTGVSLALPFLTPGDVVVPAVLGLALHLPFTTALDVRRARSPIPVPSRDLLIVAADVAMLALVVTLAARVSMATVLGLVMVGFHRWMYGRAAGIASVAAVVLAAGAVLGTDAADGDWFDIGGLAFGGVLLVWLVDGQASQRTRVAHGLHLVAGRAEAVLSGIGESIVTTDVRGRIRELNPAAARLLGCDPATVRLRSCQEVLALQSDRRALSCDEGCALLGATDADVGLWRTGPQGERQPVLATAVPLYGPTGAVVEIVHSLRDITSLKAADEAKTMFLATASHELKTPLAVIQGFAQLLQQTDAPAEVREKATESIQRRASELASIVDRLLMSSRIEFGEIDLAPVMTRVAPLLRDRVREFGHASGRDVGVDLDADLPEVWADPTAVVTVIDHLLENAAKYSPGGGAIRARIGHAEGGVFVEVSDEGVGMTDEQLQHCFDRFWQAERSDGRRFGGTGIGLYIVRSLVEAMEGTISVDSAPGQGATFRFVLRATSPEEPPAELVRVTREDGEQSMIREFMRQVGVLDVAGPSR